MKRLIARLLILLIFLACSHGQAQQDPFISDFLERLDNSRQYLILIAENMPEEKYDYQATPESLTFAESLMHIGFALDWHSQSLLGGREPRDWETDTVYKTQEKSKSEMIKTVDDTFTQAIELIGSFDPKRLDEELDYFGLTRSKRQILLLLADHITHHRGQMLVLMRLNGLTPPRYVLYQ